MTETPHIGAKLAWLLDHRGLGVTELADRAGLEADEVRGVLAEARRLSAAQVVHVAEVARSMRGDSR